MPLPWLKPDKIVFPPIELALKNPNGLLAAGGALSKDWLMSAYRHGAFPWYESGQPILWWSPDPRLVLTPESLKISRSLRKLLRKNRYNISFDTCFSEVINHCSEARRDGGGTWMSVPGDKLDIFKKQLASNNVFNEVIGTVLEAQEFPIIVE